MRTTEFSRILALLCTALLIPSQIGAAVIRTELIAQRAEEVEAATSYDAWNRRFVVHKNGIVTDTKAGVEWFVGPDKDTTWDEAKSWVKGLSLDGGGWRLPTREELRSLYRRGAGQHNLSPAFKTSGGYAWSGEAVGSSYAWGFCFEIGAEYWPLRTFSDTARAFAVRAKKDRE